MSKKGGGASEINGFISVPSSKSKSSSVKPSATLIKNAPTSKKTSSTVSETSQKKMAGSNAKKLTNEKPPLQGPQVKKTEPVTARKKPVPPAIANPAASRVKASASVKTPSTTASQVKAKTPVVAQTAVRTVQKPRAPTNAKNKATSLSVPSTSASVSLLRQREVTNKANSGGVAKPTTVKTSPKTHGKNRLSYTVNLTEPLEASSKKVTPDKMVPISRQGTFVKDEDQGTSSQYSEDFEAYESDFEEDSTAPELQVEVSEERPSRDDQNSFNQNELSSKPNEGNIDTEPKEYEYEDDFEDYESDFEEDTESGFTSPVNESRVVTPEPENKSNKAVEEERKLDSGNYDLMSKAGKIDRMKPRQLNEIKEAVTRENSLYKERSVGGTKSDDESPDSAFENDVNILNFKEACKRSESQQAATASRIRAQQLSSMIRLYAIDFSLLEMSPTPYDEFIKLFGRNDYTQVASQTGEDALNEETQTDTVQVLNKWTQFPVEYHKLEGKSTDLAVYFHDREGCGSDDLPKVPRSPTYDVQNLEEFLSIAGEVILIILEEEATDNSQMALSIEKSDFMEFSDGFAQINPQNIEFLRDRQITNISFSPHNPNTLVMCHDESKFNEDSEQSYIDYYYSRCVLSIWNVLRPAQPEHTLVSSCAVSCCCFDNVNAYVFFAGLTDGTISLWDLSERIHFHKQSLPNVDLPFILRSPTYCACSRDQSDEKHVSRVINVKSTGREFHQADRFSNGRIKSTELVSLSEDGELLVWTVVNINEGTVNNDPCLAPWGKIKLALSASFNTFNALPERIDEGIECTCMSVNRAEWANVLVGTNAGVVLNCSPYGVKVKIPQFGHIDPSVTVTCIDFHPKEPSLFLVAYSDGITKLYSTNKDHPLISFVKQDIYSSPISLVKWSPNKAGFFVILDEQCSLQIWDLCKADLAPQHAVLVNIENKCFDLSRNVKFPCMAFVTNQTTVRLYKFKKRLTSNDSKTVDEELELLKMYTSKFI